jgi:hypothetical protein
VQRDVVVHVKEALILVAQLKTPPQYETAFQQVGLLCQLKQVPCGDAERQDHRGPLVALRLRLAPAQVPR